MQYRTSITTSSNANNKNPLESAEALVNSFRLFLACHPTLIMELSQYWWILHSVWDAFFCILPKRRMRCTTLLNRYAVLTIVQLRYEIFYHFIFSLKKLYAIKTPTIRSWKLKSVRVQEVKIDLKLHFFWLLSQVQWIDIKPESEELINNSFLLKYYVCHRYVQDERDL